MTEATDEFYTFSSTELAAIKADYRQLLADQRAHNRQFQKRRLYFILMLIDLGAIAIVGIYGLWLVREIFFVLKYISNIKAMYLLVIQHLDTYFLILLLVLMVIVSIIEFIRIKHKKELDRILLNNFPMTTVRYQRTPYLKVFHVQQTIKLPAYLIVWPKNKEISIIPSPDRVNCWLIRRADQADLYDKLSSSYRKN
ncbi:hypothetical protein [Oenococcus sicerae]|uniref:hypothetical protein n=1 Tax=Oenococcus sicerae TaxID=2203724 RepID=UPI0010B887CF|nr:hypothetical protein OAL24_01342 [Oenococcus sicerae]